MATGLVRKPYFDGEQHWPPGSLIDVPEEMIGDGKQFADPGGRVPSEAPKANIPEAQLFKVNEFLSRGVTEIAEDIADVDEAYLGVIESGEKGGKRRKTVLDAIKDRRA